MLEIYHIIKIKKADLNDDEINCDFNQNGESTTRLWVSLFYFDIELKQA
jgi:hypothetical protein